MQTNRILAASIGAALALSVSAQAAVLSGVGNFEGTAGILGPNGVVTAPPGGSAYVYVSTAGSSYTGAGLGQGSETNG